MTVGQDPREAIEASHELKRIMAAMERLPVERALTEQTRAFKAI